MANQSQSAGDCVTVRIWWGHDRHEDYREYLILVCSSSVVITLHPDHVSYCLLVAILLPPPIAIAIDWSLYLDIENYSK